jgi:hypothetical protein
MGAQSLRLTLPLATIQGVFIKPRISAIANRGGLLTPGVYSAGKPAHMRVSPALHLQGQS